VFCSISELGNRIRRLTICRLRKRDKRENERQSEIEREGEKEIYRITSRLLTVFS